MSHARPFRRWSPLAALLLPGVLLTACGGTTTPSAGQSLGGTPSGAGGTPASARPLISAAPQAARPGTKGVGTTSASPSASGLAGLTVVLDPGHNGGNAANPGMINALVPMGGGQEKACDTTGTESNDGYQEHTFNLDVAQRVAALLGADGIHVILTRTNDTGVGPCVNVRAQIGNDAHAAAAVSIHADGYDGQNGQGHGFQILEAANSAGGPSVDLQSGSLGNALHGTFVAESGLVPSTYIGTNGYDIRGDLAGLNLSTVPKVLVECGNMRDAGDAALEESPAGRQRIAQAIADGIIAYLRNR